MYKKLEINPSARNALQSGHPWIFSGKVLSHLADYENGEVVYVYCEGKFLGTGFVSPNNSICVRMISRSREVVEKDFFIQRFLQLKSLKQRVLSGETNMYRFCFSEADFVPGLIVDVYGKNLVIQTNSAGVMKNLNVIKDALIETLNPSAIIDRTDEDTYKLEHFVSDKPRERVLHGSLDSDIMQLKENGILFYVDIVNGHKTGFYLDQRENRELVGKISSGKRILNLCSYTGGFTLYGLKNNADFAVSVDVSSKALSLLSRNVELNGFKAEKSVTVKADMFDFVSNEDLEKYDIVIVDPPAFAKHVSESKQAEKAYKFINSAVLKKVKPATFILTSSCTSVVNADMFSEIIEKSIRDSRRNVKIIKKTFLPSDHPSLFHFIETEYLKSFLLYAL
ncbi:MAG: class I SAM-dependent rRNA methyltransferase [bacterium]|nr:class I SAM-dependent rRNA methyltransferase [bacterium]